MMFMENNVNIFSHKVNKDAKLFDYLKNELILSFRQTNAFIKNNQLMINKKIVTKNKSILEGDIISLHFENETNDYEPENIPLNILYETDDLLIIDKPPHYLVHPTKNHTNHTIANSVSYYFQKQNLKRKIRFVNRLDRDTSGILVIAKNPYSHSFLTKQFERNQTIKKYLTIIDGHLNAKNGAIETRIHKDVNDIKYQVNDKGKLSMTLYKVLKENEKYSLVECELKSGRTHQIRLSLASIGAYILGDSLYYETSDIINRQALHAYRLNFIEPRTFKKQEIICELPQDMKKIIL
ncbi:RluA family pseudouridine synthase [Mycoplasmatota bacterium]|nr:RluA family pseudouridine synthase [Mycoplasmatota bacterium]